MLVLGDTNSCLAAVMAKRMRIPVYHMEAGNRCFDENVPEETNRRLVDHVADFNLVYTEHARRNLLAEGLHPRRILKTGSPMKEVLAAHADAIDASDAARAARPGSRRATSWSARTARRTSTTPSRLDLLLDCLEAAVEDSGMPVLVSTHPRTRKRLDALGRDVPGSPSTSRSASSTTTGCRRSATACCPTPARSPRSRRLLDFPAVTLRDSIERPEALDSAARS